MRLSQQSWLISLFFLIVCLFSLSVRAALITFESGSDSVPIRVAEPGIQFTTTDGQDWVYGDWRTGSYNGLYPNGRYFSFGNFFAWLGPNQGLGRIDFDIDVAEAVQVRYSSFSTVRLEAFSAGGVLLASDVGSGNLDTGSMGILEVEEPGIAYVHVHDSGNYWLVDNLDFELADVRLLELDLQEDANEVEHRTDEYDDLIVFRRAGELNVNVVVTQGYDKDYYDLTLIAKGPDGVESVAIPGTGHGATDWFIQLGEPQPKSWLPIFTFDDYVVVPVKVFAPYDIPVGEYELSARLQRKNGVGTPETLAAEDPIYFIFNPWSTLDDDVFDASWSDGERAAYVLNERGTIFVGAGATSPKSWNYAQFDDAVFEITLQLLEGLPVTDRNKAWRVSRHLSAVANSQNDGGVLVGKWCKADDILCYLNMILTGRSPSSWSSSKDIFRSYRSSGSVKYGQCWVFGGVLNSMARSLGIPSRVVTNTRSAHDTQPYDGKITTYIGTPPPGERGESIWNFHVWNEAWMNRPDRSTHATARWQAFDGTPQELSDGLFQAGPAPVTAIKADVGGRFDVDFIRAEVQATEEQIFYDPSTGTETVLNSSQFRSDYMPTLNVSGGGAMDLLHNYCEDCLMLPALDMDTNHHYVSVLGLLGSGLNLLIPSVHAASPLAGMHAVNISFDGPVSLGGTATGNIAITNSGVVEDTVTVHVFFKSRSSNGDTIEDWGQTTTPGVAISSGGTVTMPFSFAVPFTDRVMPGFDGYALQVAVIGQNGAGGNEEIGNVSGASLDVSAKAVSSDGSAVVSAVLRNTLERDMTGVVLTMQGPPEAQISEPVAVPVGLLAAGYDVEAEWTVQVPPGKHDFAVEVIADGLLPSYGHVAVDNPGPASLKLRIDAPVTVSLGQPVNASVDVYNTGGVPLDADVTVRFSEGLGGGEQVFQVANLEGGLFQPLDFNVQGSETGVQPLLVTAIAQTAEGEIEATASTVLAVTTAPVQAEVILTPSTLSAGTPGAADMTVSTNAGSETQVQLVATASDADKRYGIYDNTQRILSESVTVPSGGKVLTLRLDESTTGGWIRVTAIPESDPTGTSTAQLTILGPDPLVVVDSRVDVRFGATRYDRRTGRFSYPVTVTNISGSNLNGAARLVISGIQPAEATVANADGTLPDGRPYLDLLPNNENWGAGESLPVVILEIHNPVRARVSFEHQVLAVIPQ
ncbi:MAG TPA: hypothetical protein DDY14_15270 [Chromatiaceae bacterium]|nr:hypothetical protein [Chromatiaceae bacterium]